jgi:FemAB-related protein (PEP-CTERM system-associated)
MHVAVQSVKCTGDLPEVDAAIQVRLHERADLRQNLQYFSTEIAQSRAARMAHDPAWLLALQAGLGHVPFLLEAVKDGRAVGWLPLALVRSRLFGRFLVSLPYLNSAGVVAVDPAVGHALIDRAVELAGEQDVRYLELRHEQRWSHPALTQELTSKTHMRLALPSTADELWLQLDAKVRNQIRKAQKQELTVQWGGADRLNEFYGVFSRNMRDLGTPAFGRKLFQAILYAFPNAAELCVVSAARRPIAAALLIHGSETTEVPSASSLRRHNATNANMLLYWHLLQRAIERGQSTFDFGRSSQDSNTYRFKKQWGAQPHPAVWQYYVRRGSLGEMRPDNPKYRLMIKAWRQMPLWISRRLGPAIVRGIP